MSKALVIKGACFLKNAIEQITVTDPIPCTGLTLSQNSISFTSVGATATLTATLVPADTTEALTWVSSNENAATVENGVVTCVGVGTATITAACGNQSATCEVTSTITIDMIQSYPRYSGQRYSGSVDIEKAKDWIGLAAQTNNWLFYSSSQLGEYKAFYGTGSTDKWLIPIPQGTSVITARYPSVFSFSALIAADSNQHSSAAGASGLCAKALKVKRLSTVDGNFRTTSLDISDISPNGFILDVQPPKADTDTSTAEESVTVTFE